MLNTPLILGTLSSIATLGYVSVSAYIAKVKRSGCECAATWKQDVILASSIFLGIINIIITFTLARHGTSILNRHSHFPKIFLAATLSHVLLSYIYINEIKDKNCLCSNNIQVLMIEALHFVNGIIVTYSTIAILVLVFATAIFVSKKQPKISK